MGEVAFYAVGLCYASACAPGEMSADDVARAANTRHPTGLDRGWAVTEPTFRTGEANPCECNTDPSRKHWLLNC